MGESEEEEGGGGKDDDGHRDLSWTGVVEVHANRSRGTGTGPQKLREMKSCRRRALPVPGTSLSLCLGENCGASFLGRKGRQNWPHSADRRVEKLRIGCIALGNQAPVGGQWKAEGKKKRRAVSNLAARIRSVASWRSKAFDFFFFFFASVLDVPPRLWRRIP